MNKIKSVNHMASLVKSAAEPIQPGISARRTGAEGSGENENGVSANKRQSASHRKRDSKLLQLGKLSGRQIGEARLFCHP